MSKRILINKYALNGYNLYSSAPIGSVFGFAGDIIPSGYLMCDGRKLLKADYNKLFSIIGYKYTPAELANDDYFYLPDYRESTLVGVGENTTKDIKKHDLYQLGEFKDDQLQGHGHTRGTQNITGQFGLNDQSTGYITGAFYIKEYHAASFGGDGAEDNLIGFDASKTWTGMSSKPEKISEEYGSPRLGSTTRGKQTGINFIIKAIDTSGTIPSNVDIDDTKTTNANIWSAEQITQYMNDQNELSDLEDIVISTIMEEPTIAEYDGYLMAYNSASNYLSVNGIGFTLGLTQPNGVYNTENTNTIPIRKGDSIYAGKTPSFIKVRYYKKRDYSKRKN